MDEVRAVMSIQAYQAVFVEEGGGCFLWHDSFVLKEEILGPGMGDGNGEMEKLRICNL